MTMIIAERANRPEWRRTRPLTPRQWCQISARLGAFNDQSFLLEKLESIGLSRELPRMNLCPPGRTYDTWPRAFAAAVADEIMRWYPREVLCLLGRKVQQAFGVDPHVPYGTLVDDCLLVLPHPSGLNRFWNDVVSVATLEAKVEGVFHGVGGCCICRHPCQKFSFCRKCKKYLCPTCFGLHDHACLSLVRSS